MYLYSVQFQNILVEIMLELSSQLLLLYIQKQEPGITKVPLNSDYSCILKLQLFQNRYDKIVCMEIEATSFHVILVS